MNKILALVTTVTKSYQDWVLNGFLTVDTSAFLKMFHKERPVVYAAVTDGFREPVSDLHLSPDFCSIYRLTGDSVPDQLSQFVTVFSKKVRDFSKDPKDLNKRLDLFSEDLLRKYDELVKKTPSVGNSPDAFNAYLKKLSYFLQLLDSKNILKSTKFEAVSQFPDTTYECLPGSIKRLEIAIDCMTLTMLGRVASTASESFRQTLPEGISEGIHVVPALSMALGQKVTDPFAPNLYRFLSEEIDLTPLRTTYLHQAFVDLIESVTICWRVFESEGMKVEHHDELRRAVLPFERYFQAQKPVRTMPSFFNETVDAPNPQFTDQFFTLISTIPWLKMPDPDLFKSVQSESYSKDDFYALCSRTQKSKKSDDYFRLKYQISLHPDWFVDWIIKNDSVKRYPSSIATSLFLTLKQQYPDYIGFRLGRTDRMSIAKLIEQNETVFHDPLLTRLCDTAKDQFYIPPRVPHAQLFFRDKLNTYYHPEKCLTLLALSSQINDFFAAFSMADHEGPDRNLRVIAVAQKYDAMFQTVMTQIGCSGKEVVQLLAHFKHGIDGYAAQMSIRFPESVFWIENGFVHSVDGLMRERDSFRKTGKPFFLEPLLQAYEQDSLPVVKLEEVDVFKPRVAFPKKHRFVCFIEFASEPVTRDLNVLFLKDPLAFFGALRQLTDNQDDFRVQDTHSHQVPWKENIRKMMIRIQKKYPDFYAWATGSFCYDRDKVIHQVEKLKIPESRLVPPPVDIFLEDFFSEREDVLLRFGLEKKWGIEPCGHDKDIVIRILDAYGFESSQLLNALSPEIPLPSCFVKNNPAEYVQHHIDEVLIGDH